jgi:chemotaxis response regulator CheB
MVFSGRTAAEMKDTNAETPIANELTSTAGSLSDEEPFFVVGIGASAVGLEALEQFFEHVPEKLRLSFFVVHRSAWTIPAMFRPVL